MYIKKKNKKRLTQERKHQYYFGNQMHNVSSFASQMIR